MSNELATTNEDLLADLFGAPDTDALPEPEQGDMNSRVWSFFILSSNGDLNKAAREALTRVENGKAVMPRDGDMFIKRDDEFLPVSADSTFFLASHKLYKRLFVSRDWGQEGRIVDIRRPVAGTRDPRNAEGCKKDAKGRKIVSGLEETAHAVLIIFDPARPSGALPYVAKVKGVKGRSRFLRKLYQASLPFVDDAKFKDSAPLLGLSKSDASKIASLGKFHSFRAGLKSDVMMKQLSSGGVSITWDADNESLRSATTAELKDVAQLAVTEEFADAANSMLSTTEFYRTVEEGLPK